MTNNKWWILNGILMCAILWALFIGGCTPSIKLKKGEKITAPASHLIQCAKAETWNEFICPNPKPDKVQ
jgi:hypothetical protein|tara:strand:+ start:5166 stop:5372 length:207 start_codon:yes stop_codon:yes gene_type:complete